MTIASIIQGLDEEIARLEQARALLSQIETTKATAPKVVAVKKVVKRNLSAAARKRIADAQHKRWAAFKAAKAPKAAPAKKPARKAPVKKTIAKKAVLASPPAAS